MAKRIKEGRGIENEEIIDLILEYIKRIEVSQCLITMCFAFD